MFLEVTRRRNPALVETAASLHRDGYIPSNSYVVDVDAVEQNARAISDAADRAGLALYQMTKQFGRNPLLATRIAASGIEKAVAVDVEEARVLHRAGVALGHVGHLVQIPRREIGSVLAMDPDLITVFGLEQARAVAAAAARSGREQGLLVRVVGENDFFYPGQRGGVPLRELVDVAAAIEALDGASFKGITSFPCILWDAERSRLAPTPNLATLERAASTLRKQGIEVPVVNAPSATCASTVDLLASSGATHGEPGSSLIGHTPLHAVSDEQPEVPCMVYVSEVTHQLEGHTFALGGGFYPRSHAKDALVFSAAGVTRASVELDPPDVIDYYGTLRVEDDAPVSVGDTVLYAFRSQVFVSRSFVVVVTGTAQDPRVLGVFDRNGNVVQDVPRSE